MEAKNSRDGTVKITIEIIPSEGKTQVKPFKKVMEFPVSHKDLPLKVSAHSARVVTTEMRLSEEMCED
jgi:hypothetical protein